MSVLRSREFHGHEIIAFFRDALRLSRGMRVGNALAVCDLDAAPIPESGPRSS